jgi:hypothetical protein
VSAIRHSDEAPEHAGGGGTMWLLAASLLVVIVVALALLVASMVADALPALEPGRLLATWASR